MKNYLNISVLSILLLSVVIYSCSDNIDDLSTNENSLNEVVFKDLSLKTNISPNFYDNHFYLIEKLGKNSERTKIINTAKEKGIDLSMIDNKDVKKFYFNNSDILMYSISVKNSENKIIIYKYNDIYQVNKAEYYLAGNKMQFNLKSLDNKMFYSLQIDDKNRLGNISIEKNEQMNSFNNNIYQLHMEKHQLDSNIYAKSSGCCRNESGWSDCMDCTVSACGSSWACAITFALLPVEMAVGMSVSCIGAGENTFC